MNLFDLDRMRAALREHWITGIECDHVNKTDRAVCSCTVWRCEPMPTVGDAVDCWISHVLSVATDLERAS